jgi:hypothetical protein
MFKYFILRAQQQRSVISAASCSCDGSLLLFPSVLMGFILFYVLGRCLPFLHRHTSTG